MSAETPAVREMVEAAAALRLPPRADLRLQVLMDRNTNGELTAGERDELESLVEVSETIGLVRARALHVLRGNRHEQLGCAGKGHSKARRKSLRILPHA